jgi:hypothetical protein
MAQGPPRSPSPREPFAGRRPGTESLFAANAAGAPVGTRVSCRPVGTISPQRRRSRLLPDDPKNGIWGSKPPSACTRNADDPDRVILTALSLHWANDTVQQRITQLEAAVKNFKAKYSNLKNLELATFVRSPGDKPCPLGDTFRAYDLARADEAFQKVAAAFPELVTVAPIVHVDSCDDYAGHPPHLPSGPAARAAMKMGAIYKESAKP